MLRLHRQKPPQPITETGPVAKKKEQAEKHEQNVGDKEKEILCCTCHLRYNHARGYLGPLHHQLLPIDFELEFGKPHAEHAPPTEQPLNQRMLLPSLNAFPIQ